MRRDENTYIFTATQGVISKDVAEEVAEQKRRGRILSTV